MQKKNYNDLKETFKVLADSNRIRIIESLTHECQSVNEIAKKAEISQPLASHHLKVLKEAGIARVESHGTFNYYWLTDKVIWQIIEMCKKFNSKGIK